MGTGEKCRIVRPLNDYKAEIEWAPKKYEEIRSLTDDITKISKNTGMPERTIKQIKDHLFYKKHILREKVARFDPDAEFAAAWDRLYHGDFIQNDLTLLEHEYFESFIEPRCVNYESAHKITETSGRIWHEPIFFSKE